MDSSGKSSRMELSMIHTVMPVTILYCTRFQMVNCYYFIKWSQCSGMDRMDDAIKRQWQNMERTRSITRRIFRAYKKQTGFNWMEN